MCGIAGIFRFDGASASEKSLRAMTGAMTHRGPDHEAVTTFGSVGLGHTRLSIIDVSSGANQPMLSHDGQYAITYNGEIYNYRELRTQLENEGVRFRTTSDTEVLLEAFVRWGPRCFSELNGMFGVAILDLRHHTLTIARDRFGIKPFYYMKANGALTFASEVKAVLAGAARKPTFNTLKLVELLLYRELIEGTFFSEIRTLEPGCYAEIRVEDPTIDERPWFAVESLVDHTLSIHFKDMPYKRRVDTIGDILSAAVSRHLLSDVPVGTLCSGGTDSSLLTALCRRVSKEVSVYHVDVKGNSERHWADLVAKHLGIEMHHVVLDERNFLNNYVDCIFYNDFPLTHPNGVAVYLISELARANGCKVLLTGEGADEMFGGYDWRYRSQLRYGALQAAIKWPKRLGSFATVMLTGVWPKKFDANFGFKSRANVADVLNVCSDFGYRRDQLQRCRERVGSDMPGRDVQASMVSDLRDYISGILHRQDRASMQASIESRVPFLDFEVARAATNLPLRDKVTWSDYKPLLKDLAARYLPREVVFRNKIGFGTPADDYACQIDRKIFKGGFVEDAFGFRGEEVARLAESDFATYGHTLIGLEFWGRMFVLDQDRAELRDRYVPSRW